ncbi:MAG: hypothetical protein R2879_06755 [Saprospiraceae bacterium]
MRPTNQSAVGFLGAFFMLLSTMVIAQQPPIQYFRPMNQDGVNVFEPAKNTSTEFDGIKVRVGGAFSQGFQALNHSNDTTFSSSANQLYDIAPGFTLATANLNLDVQLADGIRLALENYMSSHHHQEFWVKGGYIQIDKLPMFNNPEWFEQYFRVKVGHFQPNFGDQQFRRTDNGAAMYNPFVGNYIMDAFTTEIGGEVYVFPVENVVGMVGLTTGLIKDDINNYVDGKERQPSLYLKLAYDNQFNDDFRFRLSGSFMANANAGRNTLYGGDRTGSRYRAVMELAGADLTSKAFSGRWNPGFSNKIMSFQLNPFVKFKGLEFFGIYEMASGNNLTRNNETGMFEFVDDNKRSVTQIGAEVLYRFFKDEQVYVGAKYNSVSGQMNAGYRDGNGDFIDASINRIELGAGWYVTRNLLLKAEYVSQKYVDFPNTTQYYEGEFNGIVIEANVGF